MTGDPGDKRGLPRTHLFVAAALYSDSGSSPVHIRNMSASGVLIEAAVLPEPKTRIILKRGSLEAAGAVAWRVGRKAGVAFEAEIHVPDWMSRQVGSHQDRIDQLLTKIRAENPLKPDATIVPSTGRVAPSIESELLLLRSELERLETGLIDDLALIAAHPEIQLLDISVQRIDRVLAQLREAA